MTKKTSIAILALAIIMCFSIAGFAQDTDTQDNDTQDDDYKEIQEEKIHKLVAAVNSADEAKIKAFILENWIEDKEKLEERVSKMAGTKDQLGELVVKTIEHDSKEVCIVSAECTMNVLMTFEFVPEKDYRIKTVKLEARQ